MEGIYVAVLLCVLLGGWILYMESRRTNRKHLRARIVASIVAVLSFLFLLIPIHFKVENNDSEDEVYLLTEGASLDSLSVKNGTIVTLDANIDSQVNRSVYNNNKEINNKIEFIPDLQYYLEEHPNVNKIRIYGYGLSEDEWKYVKNYDIRFYPSPVPKGVITSIWERELNSTELLRVHGTYYNPDVIPVKLVLHGLGSDLDSVFIKKQDSGRFLLVSQPVQTGQVLYELIAIAGTDTLSREPIPFQVRDEKPMKILLLASSPDFEYKFLKNWLAENQYPVVFRARITKDKYSMDFLNIEQRSLNNINPATLREFDFVMVDEEELATLSHAELAAIKNEVEAGMGIFIRLAESQFKSALTKGFTFYKPSFLQNKTLELSLIGDTKLLSSLSVVPTTLIRASLHEQPLVLDARGNIYVNSRIQGIGKVIVSTLGATYPWLLAGNVSDYSLFWSSLFANGARTKELAVAWKVFPEFPLTGQKNRIALSLETESDLPKILLNGTNLSPRQNIELPFQWDAYAWPEKGGWNSLLLNEQQYSFFVYDQDDWKVIQAYEKIQAGKTFVNSNLKIENDIIKNRHEEKTFDKGWFFMTFLLAVSFLWYESRVLANK